MKPSLGLTLGTQLALTPALQQSIRLLQLSSLELAQELSAALEDNPFLERDFDPDLDPQRFESSGTWDQGAAYGAESDGGFSGDTLLSNDSIGLGDRYDSQSGAQEFAEYASGGEAPETGFDEGGFDTAHDHDTLGWEGDGSHSGTEFDVGLAGGASAGPDSTEWGCDAPAAGTADFAGASDAGRSSAGSGSGPEAWTSLAPQNLHELLQRQIEPCVRTWASQITDEAAKGQTATLQAALEFVTGCVDGRGFLLETAAELALAWQLQNTPLNAPLNTPHNTPQNDTLPPVALFETALTLLRSFEPAGVGARDAMHCVALQLARQEAEGDYRPRELPALQLAQQLCTLPLAMLARRDYKGWAKRFEVDETLLRSAYGRLRSCSPEPALAEALHDWNAEGGAHTALPASAAAEPLHTLRPDITVQLLRGKGLQFWQARLVADPQLSVKVSRQAQWLKLNEAKTTQTGQPVTDLTETSGESLNEKVQNARWWVRSLQQRNESLLRVAQAVVDVQQAYFSRGVTALRPLVLRQIADATQLHESTVSRLTTGKYIATPHGVKELKFFFAASLGVTSAAAMKNMAHTNGVASNTVHGAGAGSGVGYAAHTPTLQATSSTAVKSHIAALIAAEPASKPLSDEKISQALAAQGIECARRTVAKYREELNLLPASARRAR